MPSTKQLTTEATRDRAPLGGLLTFYCLQDWFFKAAIAKLDSDGPVAGICRHEPPAALTLSQTPKYNFHTYACSGRHARRYNSRLTCQRKSICAYSMWDWQNFHTMTRDSLTWRWRRPHIVQEFEGRSVWYVLVIQCNSEYPVWWLTWCQSWIQFCTFQNIPPW